MFLPTSDNNYIIGNPEEFEFRVTRFKAENIENSSSDSKDTFIFISDLQMNSEMWSIKVRIIKKRPYKFWNNKKGSGKLFSFDAMDQSGSICITAFNDLADKFFEMFEEDKVYIISNGQIKQANKIYNIDSNDYEIIINKDTQIKECANDSVPFLSHNIIMISDIFDLPEGELVDTIGLCWDIDDIEYIYSGKKPLRKRDVVIFDVTGSIKVTFWNEEADDFSYELQTVLLIHKGRVSQYEGKKYISITRHSIIRRNPQIPGNQLCNSFMST